MLGPHQLSGWSDLGMGRDRRTLSWSKTSRRCMGVKWIEIGVAFGSLGFFAECNLESYADDINLSSCFNPANVQMIHRFPTISGTTFCKFISKDVGAEFDAWKLELCWVAPFSARRTSSSPWSQVRGMGWDMMMRYDEIWNQLEGTCLAGWMALDNWFKPPWQMRSLQ